MKRNLVFLLILFLGVAVGSAGMAQSKAPAELATTALSELLAALRARDAAKVHVLLQADPSLVNARTPRGDAVILLAVFATEGLAFQRPETNPLVAEFLTHRPDLDVFSAAVTGDLRRVSALVGQDPALVRAASPSGWMALHFAAFSGNVELVRFLLDRGADIGVRGGREKTTPLQAALLTQRTEVARLLLERGADPLQRLGEGYAPLHEAALLGNTELIQLLVDHGAELNSKNDHCESPLDLAVKNHSNEAAALLRRLGAEGATR